ncbi:MAG: hypothetical protein K2W95_35620 [Candidatus Obscuribacterales bacterium]|nr:hypothetical protein [Candidatus Obscuribacterales bacterium]
MNYTVMVAATILLLTGATVAVAFSDWQHEFYWRRERDMFYFSSVRDRLGGGDSASALTRLNKALAYERKLPNDGLIHFMLHYERADLLASRKQYRDAVAEADIAEKRLESLQANLSRDLANTRGILQRNHVNLLIRRADYLIRSGEYRKALQDLKKADEFVVQNYESFHGIAVLPLVIKSTHVQSLLHKKLGQTESAALLAEREAQLNSYEGAERWAEKHKLVLSFADANPDLKISEVLLAAKTAIGTGAVESAANIMNKAMKEGLFAAASWSWQQKFCREALSVASMSRAKGFHARCLTDCWPFVQKSATRKLSPWQLETRERLLNLACEERRFDLMREMLVSFAQLVKVTDTSTVLLPDLRSLYEPHIALLMDVGQWSEHMDDLRKIDDAMRSVGKKIDMCEIAYIRNLCQTNEFVRAEERLRKLMQVADSTDHLKSRILGEALTCARRWRDRKQPEMGEALLADTEKMYAGKEVPLSLLLCKADMMDVQHKHKEHDAIIRTVVRLASNPARKDRSDALDFMMDVYMNSHEFDKAEALFRAKMAALPREARGLHYQWCLSARKTNSAVLPASKGSFLYRLMHDGLMVVRREYGVNSAEYMTACYNLGVFDYFNQGNNQDLKLALSELNQTENMSDSDANRIPSLLIKSEILRQLGDLDAASRCDEHIAKLLPRCSPQTWFGLRCLSDACFVPRFSALSRRCAVLMESTRERYMEK